MKDCYGTYEYKGWYFYFSEYRQGWTLEATEKNMKKIIDNLTEEKYYRISDEWRNSFDTYLKTINRTKKYIRENEDNLLTLLKSIIDEVEGE